MSRPASPSYAIRTWAPNANYPSTPGKSWSLQPTKVEPPGAASVGFTPETGAAAEHFNKLFFDSNAQDTSAKTELQTHLTWHGQIPALNFPVKVSTSVATHLVKWHAPTRQWYGIGLADDDVGIAADVHAWSSSTIIPGGEVTGEQPWDFDLDTAGNILVLVNSGVDQYLYFDGAAWDHKTGLVGDDWAVGTGAIVFDEDSGNWILAGSFPTVNVYTNTDPTSSWSLAGGPTGIPNNAKVSLASDGAGGIVLQAFSGTNTYFSKSTDGGITWSATVTAALGFTHSFGNASLFTTRPKPAWNGSYWLAIGSDRANGHSRVFKSTNGTSWSAVATYTGTMAMHWIACLGELWAATTFTRGVVFSTDEGATWQFGSDRITAQTIAAGGGRFVLASELFGTIPGIAMGNGAGTVPTS